MTLLFLRLIEAYIDADVKESFESLGCKVMLADMRSMWKGLENLYEDPKLEHWLCKTLEENGFDAVYTTNFFPVVAKICHKYAIKYLSWYYDTPPMMKPGAELAYPTNRLFFFNEKDYRDYRSAGVDNVFFLPLAVNTKRIDGVIKSNKGEYSADVSMVGNLYHSVYSGLKNLFSQYIQGYLDGIVAIQQQLYEEFVISELLPDSILEIMLDEYNHLERHRKELNKKRIEYAISTWITYQDRIALLGMCGRRFRTKLYTTETDYNDEQMLESVRICKPVDYLTEMPLVFAESKVNLCPILRINRNGIPLRALDIMGCGGLLLVDYQPELARRFVPGEEMLMYHSIPEAIEMIAYYLKREDERDSIALKGRKKIEEEYQYRDRIKAILKQAE